MPVRNLVVQRFAVASERGCDGVEPDNVDDYGKTPGSPSPLMTSWTSTVESICRGDPARANCDRLEGWGQKGFSAGSSASGRRRRHERRRV